MVFKEFLEKLAIFQKKYAIPIAILVVLITVFLGYGITKVEMQTDMNKEMPQDLPIFQLNDMITSEFGGQDIIFIIFQIDESMDIKGLPTDIRTAYMFQYLNFVEDALVHESSIESVISPSTFLEGIPIYTDEMAIAAVDSSPAAQSFISKDYKTLMMYIRSDIGSSDKKTTALTNLINNKVKGLSTPPGVKVMVTGTPPMRMLIFYLLGKDAIFTLLVASAIIFVLLLILERSLSKTIVIFTPLMLGLIWTMGTLGWLGIQISIATAGLGAMILGLGVEYGVFMYTRYHEERDKGLNQIESLKKAVPGVGSAILGSGSTTIIGFLALTLSVMPMLQKLGFSLALGIFYCLVGAVFVEPIVVVLEEQIMHKTTHKLHKKLTHQKEKNKAKSL